MRILIIEQHSVLLPGLILFILLQTMVVEVTGKAIEETAAVDLRLYHTSAQCQESLNGARDG